MEFKNYVGIDISKEQLDIAILTKEGEITFVQCSNDIKEIEKAIIELLSRHEATKEDTLFCAEHTGHYGKKLIYTANNLNLKLWIESPYKILHSQGLVRGKNDKIDSQRIAEYAKRFSDKLVLHTMCSQTVEKLKHMTSERELLVKDKAKYEGQLKQEEGFIESTYFKGKKKRVQRMIKILSKAIDEIEKEIDKVINADAEIKRHYEIMLSIQGIGKQTAIATIVATNNFTKFDNARKFICHTGCAPFRYMSGKSKKSANKVSHKANKNMKRLFHMAAVSTIRLKGEMKEYYERKVSEGKNKMSVINAIRAKLITRIFALIKSGRKYEKNYTHSLA